MQRINKRLQAEAASQLRKSQHSVDIEIQRLSYSKRKKCLPNKKIYVDQIKIMKEKINASIADKTLTVEMLLVLAEEISALDFEYPLPLLEPLQEMVWSLFSEALLIRDHYAISILSRISLIVGIEMDFFTNYLKITKQRELSIIARIESLLNLGDI